MDDNPVNDYLCNCKLERSGNPAPAGELQDEPGMEWYDYGARFYDAQIGRFSTQDAFADNFPVQSPYCYASNNPIAFVDINGDSTFIAQNGSVINAQRDDDGNLIDNIIMIQNDDNGYDFFGNFGDENLDVSGIMENMLAENSEEAKSINGLEEFGEAVETGSDWDLKNNKETIFGVAWEYDEGKEDKTTFSFGEYKDMTAADVGNYHFGYVGKFVDGGKGISNYILWKGAGWAEAGKEWSEGSKMRAILRYNALLTPLSRRSGDRKIDFKWTTNGMNDANKKKE